LHLLPDPFGPLAPQAAAEMKQSLARVASDSELNQFVRDFVGEMVVEADGGIRPKEAAVPGGQMAEAIQYRSYDYA